MITADVLSLDHLRTLTDRRGVFEHADHDVVRREHGYCLDDVARALVVTVRDAERAPNPADDLIEIYLAFVEAAVAVDGRAYNRMNADGRWTDSPELGDWWGRAVFALGFTATHARDEVVRGRAVAAFERAAQRRSPHLRSMASAAIGAAELLASHPQSDAARRLLIDAIRAIPESPETAWPWPEPRLRYGNATITEALLAAGAALDDRRLTDRGVTALSFLVRVETRDGHLSVTGTAGRGPDEHGAQFDQQPIEVAAMADASGRAFRLGLGDRWAATVRRCWAWFLGDNDAGVPMIDRGTGAGFDGLSATGRNENRGAESTLAAISTDQQLRALSPAGAG